MGLFSSLISASTEAVLFVDDNKDKFLLGLGIIAGIATVGTTVKGTLNCKKIIDDHNYTMAMIKCAEELQDDYKDSAREKEDVIHSYTVTALGIAKEVALPVALGATTVACFVGEHCIMQNKINTLTETVVGLSAAYTAIDQAFKKYRKNVISELGQEADDRFRFGVKKEKIEVEEEQPNGKIKKVKKDISYIEEGECCSDYAKFWDGVNSGSGDKNSLFVWKDPLCHLPDWDSNIHILNCQRSLANQMLQKRGYLFLNEVYDLLDIPKTQAGQVVGWIYDPENPEIDSFVDFGTYQIRNKKVVNCEPGYEYEQCILLDFNVDGVIIDKIGLGSV